MEQKISPNLLKTIILDVQEIQPSPGKINTKKITPRHTEAILKEKNLKSNEGKNEILCKEE